jgi:hypothetical protein
MFVLLLLRVLEGLRSLDVLGAHIRQMHVQAQDNVLFTGKIEEYEAAFNLVDTEKKGAATPGDS